MPIYNKITVNNDVLIDLSQDTITEDNVLSGLSFHNSAGEEQIGTFTLDDEVAAQNDLLNQISEALINKTSVTPVIEPLTVTESGTYTPPEGVDGYAPVTVEINAGPDIDPYAFLYGGIETIDTGDVMNVVGYACYAQVNIKTVNLPNVTVIGSNAFRGCTGLTSFVAPKVTSLGSYMLYGCNAITELNFPLAKSLPSSRLYQCTALTKLDLGAATSLAGSSLAYCTKLKTLILRRTNAITTITSTTFSGISSFSGYVYVPRSLLESYMTDATWSAFTTRFRAIEDYPDICG